MWKSIEKYDQVALYYINRVWENSFCDAVMPWLRQPLLWAPLYLFFIVLVFSNFGKKSWVWLLFIIATITLSDQMSSNLIKNYFARVRPCNDPFMLEYIYMRVKSCPGAFSFTSSHACNHFAIATFLIITLKNTFGNKIKWLWFWAFSICYAQMYMGVHYPIDIFGGAVLGVICGYITGTLSNKYGKLEIKDLSPVNVNP